MTPSEIRAARETLGLLQEEIAPLLGYGAATRVSAIETGAARPSKSVILLLQLYLSGCRPANWPGEGRD